MIPDGSCDFCCRLLHLFPQASAKSDATREPEIQLRLSVSARLTTWFYSHASAWESFPYIFALLAT